MKYIITLSFLFLFLYSKGQYKKEIKYNLEQATRYDSLRNCSIRCAPDSTRYYKGMSVFYINEVEYYWTLEYGYDDMIRVETGAYNPFTRTKCKCN